MRRGQCRCAQKASRMGGGRFGHVPRFAHTHTHTYIYMYTFSIARALQSQPECRSLGRAGVSAKAWPLAGHVVSALVLFCFWRMQLMQVCVSTGRSPGSPRGSKRKRGDMAASGILQGSSQPRPDRWSVRPVSPCVDGLGILSSGPHPCFMQVVFSPSFFLFDLCDSSDKIEACSSRFQE